MPGEPDPQHGGARRTLLDAADALTVGGWRLPPMV